jgi:DNA-binding GntR family transcriptional regulator
MENLKLEAIDHKGLWASVMSNLTKSILNGELKPGDQLVESIIAEHMQVSRGPVRDALIRLENEGLVENIPRKGTFVRKLNKGDFKQIFELRTSLESLAVRLVIEKLDGNAQLVPSLRNIAKQMGEAAGKENIVQTADFDLVFHQTICESSSNRYLIEAWMRISTLIRLCLITDLVFKNYGQTEQDHNLIIEAIAEKNSNFGEERIKSHIASSSTLLFGET